MNNLQTETAHTFRSLKHHDFRLYFLGQIVSLSGTWMQYVAVSWLVYRLTNSPAMLGIMECANLLPMLFFGLPAGWFADHFDRRKTMIVTQSLSMIQAAILAYLTITNQVQIWQCICLSVFLGTASAWEIPSRQSFMVDLVDKKDLVNAVSLNSSLFNGARFIGPALAGVLVAKFGEGLCFALNAVSYLAMLLALLSMRYRHEPHHLADGKGKFSVTEAFQFVSQNVNVRPVLILSIFITIFGLQYTVLLPVMAKEILHGGVETLGTLRAVGGLGALIAALILANKGHGAFLGKAVGGAALGIGLSLILFGLSTNFYLSAALCLFTGFFMTTLLSGSHSLIQLNVTDKLRGRVMSIYMTIMLGINPIGSFGVGLAATHWGAPQTIVVCAAISALAGLLYVLHHRKRAKDEIQV